MQTPATVALDEAGVAYRTTEYDAGGTDRHFGDRAVVALGFDPDTVGKTLIATLPVFIDERLTSGEQVHVSAGRRGLELSLAPEDLIAATDVIVADLSTGDTTR